MPHRPQALALNLAVDCHAGALTSNLPIHLFGDRALFGNFLKPFAVPFEPHEDPAFARFRGEIEARSQPAEVITAQGARTA